MDNTDPNQPAADYQIETDFHGETLCYIEPTRRTRMIRTWSSRYTVYSDSIEPWLNADGSTTPLTEEDRKLILSRVVSYALMVQRVKMNVE